MLYVVRHGQTTYNELGRVQGHIDTPLSDYGKSQARAVALELKGIVFDKIYSSPLSRAYDTAAEINKYHNQEIILDDRLKEFKLGSFEGQLWDKMSEKESEDVLIRTDLFGGETRLMMCARIKDFLREILSSVSDNCNILLVAHGGVVNTINNIVKHNMIEQGMWEWNPIKNTQCEKYDISVLKGLV